MNKIYEDISLDVNDEYQKFSKIGTIIYNYKVEKAIDIGNSNGLWIPSYDADNQESMLL